MSISIGHATLLRCSQATQQRATPNPPASNTALHTAVTPIAAYLPDASDGVGGPVGVDHAQGKRRLAGQQLLGADLDVRGKYNNGAQYIISGRSVVLCFSNLAIAHAPFSTHGAPFFRVPPTRGRLQRVSHNLQNENYACLSPVPPSSCGLDIPQP